MKLTLTLSVLMFSALSFAQVSPAQKRDYKAIQKVIKNAQKISSSDLKCSTDLDCVVLELGSKACGGPNGYMIASSRNVNFGKVESLARKSQELESDYNLNYGVMSDCMMEMPPVVDCEGVCRQQVR